LRDSQVHFLIPAQRVAGLAALAGSPFLLLFHSNPAKHRARLRLNPKLIDCISSVFDKPRYLMNQRLVQGFNLRRSSLFRIPGQNVVDHVCFIPDGSKKQVKIELISQLI
jgi:hypothetical protein